MIVKSGSDFIVKSEKGKNLGTYKTKAEAEKRLKQIEMFKHMKKDESKNFHMNLITKIYEEGFNPFIAKMIPSTIKSETPVKLYHPIEKAMLTYRDEVKKLIPDRSGEINFSKLRNGPTGGYTHQLELELNAHFMELYRKSNLISKRGMFSHSINTSKSYITGNFITVRYVSNFKLPTDSFYVECALLSDETVISGLDGGRAVSVPYSKFDSIYLEMINNR
jgi:hypothetical protein